MTQDANRLKYTKLFTEYVINNHKYELQEIIAAHDETLTYPVYVDCGLLISEVVEVSFKFFVDSAFYLELLQESVLEAQKHIFLMCPDESQKLSLKKKVVIRLHSLPDAEEIEIKIPKCKHTNKFISFSGTVTKCSSAKMIESIKKYTCSKCGTEIDSFIDYTHEDIMPKPTKCTKDGCMSNFFNSISSEKSLKENLKDYQEIKVQEKLDVFSVGTIPRSVFVILEDDLVDSCKPGDDVTINGLVIEKWSRLIPEMRADIDLIIHANFIKVNNDEQSHVNITKEKEKQFIDFWEDYTNKPMTGRNLLLLSLCPQLYGMYIVKLAVMLVLTGGVSRCDSSGMRIRGESHLLLVGDPGTGKSQFLKYAQKIIPRSVMTTGTGSTSAGLTAAASRDGGQWHLEAGALVLADGGICCVDEFNCMKEHDKLSMLEAMEQQTISVAKAGITCKLKTQCSVLAACNPKGQYDSAQPLSVNIALSSPLLSRFDVVLLLLDTPNYDWDTLASTFLLQGKDLLNKNQNAEIWSLEKLRLYINYVKSTEPSLTKDANRVIQAYYTFQRGSDERNAARTTVRMLESVIRLSQAHAKLMLRDKVIVMDAVVCIALIECSLNKSSSFGDVNILHTNFPINAEVEYRNQANEVLKKLKLYDILEKELEIIEEIFLIEDQESNTNVGNDMTSQITNNASKNTIDCQSQVINESLKQRQIQASKNETRHSAIEQNSNLQQEIEKENKKYGCNNDTIIYSTVFEEKKTSRKRKIDTSALLELHSQFQAEVSTTQIASQTSKKSKTIQPNTTVSLDDSTALSQMDRQFTSNFNDDDLNIDI